MKVVCTIKSIVRYNILLNFARKSLYAVLLIMSSIRGNVSENLDNLSPRFKKSTEFLIL